MSEDDKAGIERAIGRLEGRVDALEAEHRTMKDTIRAVDGKLDAIMAKLNQSMGGLAAGKLFAATVTAVAGAVWAVWSHFFR